jgi:hypothetical protein
MIEYRDGLGLDGALSAIQHLSYHIRETHPSHRRLS